MRVRFTLDYKKKYLTRQEQILIYNDGLPRPNLNPDNDGPIVHRPMGLPITAGCDTAWNRTRVCSDDTLALRCSALDCCATQEPLMLVRTKVGLRCGIPMHKQVLN